MGIRSIEFRAKRVDNGEWVYGSFIPDLLEVLQGDQTLDGYIKPFGKTKEERMMVEVERNTVGQYTGLTDKNGTKIFEGDIILNKYVLAHSETKLTKEQRIGVIIYDKCEFRADKYVNGKIDGAFWIKHIWKGDSIEVIGNIHDNSELLKNG